MGYGESGIGVEDIKPFLSNQPKTAAFGDTFPQGVFSLQPFESKPLSGRAFSCLYKA
jgi:hypothetical protein